MRCRWFCTCTCARSTSMPATRPGGLQVGGLLAERLARCPAARAPTSIRLAAVDRLEIQVDGDEHDEVAGRLDAARLGALVERRGARVVERAQIDDRLRQRDARVEDVERADDRRVGLEAEDREVDHRAPLVDRCRDVRQQVLRARASARRAPASRSLPAAAGRGCTGARASTASLTESASGCGEGGPGGGALPRNGLGGVCAPRGQRERRCRRPSRTRIRAFMTSAFFAPA